MVKDRVKEIIFKKLYMDLSKSEIIPYKDGIWFINRDKKYWYLEYKKNGALWWRHDFFENFFFMFCLNREDYEPIICEWVEGVLNYKVIKTWKTSSISSNELEDVLNCKVTKSFDEDDFEPTFIEGVLNCKVTKPALAFNECENVVEDVLNCKVITPTIGMAKWTSKVEEVLNCKINRTNPFPYPLDGFLDEVLNSNIPETGVNNRCPETPTDFVGYQSPRPLFFDVVI